MGLGSVTANLAVSLNGGATFLQVQAFEHGTFAEAVPDMQRCFLQALFLCVRGGIRFHLPGQALIVCEQGQLQGCFLRNVPFTDQPGGAIIASEMRRVLLVQRSRFSVPWAYFGVILP